MAANILARLPDVKADVAGLTGTTLDETYLRAMEAASREIEGRCGRRFYSQVATHYYDGNGKSSLLLPTFDDLISVTTLKVDDDGDGTYELTLAADTDYWLWPDNSTPKRRIDINPESTQLAVFPRGRRRVQLVGKFGYSDEAIATALTGTVATTTGTTLTASADASVTVYPGDTIYVEDEQMYVSAVSTTSITVERGVNGTTAATHSAKTISVRRYPRPIEEAVKLRVVAGRWDNNQGMPFGEGSANGFRTEYARYLSLIDQYMHVGFA